VRQRAALLRAPSGRAALQLGLSNRRDFYHFLLSTVQEDAAPGKRIGIARDGSLHVWRKLYISASEAEAALRFAHGLELRVRTAMPSGIGSRSWIGGAVDPELRTLSSALHLRGAAAPARASLKRESATIRFEDGRVGSVRLVDAASGEPLSFAKGRRRLRERRELEPASAPLLPVNARLVLKNVATEDAPADDPCDVRRAQSPDGAAPASALLFRPAAEPPAAPAVPAMYAEGGALRVAAGEGDDTDTATRLSIGAAIEGEFHAALNMDGARCLRLAAAPDQSPDGVLAVEGSVHLPPIGSKDPLLPELLMLAYIGGLRRVGNVTSFVTITLSHVQGARSRIGGTPPSYQIALNRSPGDGYTLKRMMELITGPDGRGDLSFRTLVLEPPGPGLAPGDTIALPAGRQGPPALEVTVLMLIEIGGKARVAVSNALSFNHP